MAVLVKCGESGAVRLSQDQLRDIYGRQIPQKAKAILHCPEPTYRDLLPWQAQQKYNIQLKAFQTAQENKCQSWKLLQSGLKRLKCGCLVLRNRGIAVAELQCKVQTEIFNTEYVGGKTLQLVVAKVVSRNTHTTRVLSCNKTNIQHQVSLGKMVIRTGKN